MTLQRFFFSCFFFAWSLTANSQWKYDTSFKGSIDFISADSGISSWDDIISVSGGNKMYGSSTIDGGKTWNVIFQSGISEGLSAEGTFACRKQHALYFDQNYQGLLTMFRSFDCKTFKPMPFKSECGPAHVYSFSAPDTAVNYLLVNPLLEKYSNGKASACFYDFSKDSFTPQLLYFPDTAIGYLMAFEGNTGLILKTLDGAKTWQTVFTDSASTFNSIYFNSLDVGYVVANSGYIIKTTDGGLAWQHVDWPGKAGLFGVYFLNDSTGYVSGDTGLIIKTIDGGRSWQQQTTGAIDAMGKIFFVNDTVGYAATRSTGLLYSIGKMKVTGIATDSSAIKNGVGIFPNPASGTIIIKATEKIITFSLYDAAGRILLSNQDGRGRTQIELNISNLLPGAYFFSLNTVGGVVFHEFFKQ